MLVEQSLKELAAVDPKHHQPTIPSVLAKMTIYNSQRLVKSRKLRTQSNTSLLHNLHQSPHHQAGSVNVTAPTLLHPHYQPSPSPSNGNNPLSSSPVTSVGVVNDQQHSNNTQHQHGRETSIEISPRHVEHDENNQPHLIDLGTLSEHYTILLVIRRYIRHGGCGFCNRRIVELVEWSKSLLQTGIVPVVLHAEDEKDGDMFFSQFNNPHLRDILRVSDPVYVNTKQLFDLAGSPLQFKVS